MLMKRFFTIFLLTYFFTATRAQVVIDIPEMPATSIEENLQGVMGCGLTRNLSVKKDSIQTRIIRSCRSITTYNEPLYIIDGILAETEALKNLNPNDIESITILKDAAATALYGHRALHGVIIITTKSAGLRQFMVKDFLDGAAIPGATVTFTAGKDTLMFAAGEDGLVETSELKPGKSYEVQVSAVGYKPFISRIQNGYKREQELLLEREVKDCELVVISGYSINRCRFLSCCGGNIINVKTEKLQEDAASAINSISGLYPNPAQRGQTITIQTLSSDDKPMQLFITDLTGRTVFSQSVKGFKGNNRLTVTADSRWTAGMYIVSLLDESGRRLQQEKLLIQ